MSPDRSKSTSDVVESTSRAKLRLACFVLLALPQLAVGQVWTREAKVDAGVTATNNGAGRASGLETADVLLTLVPSVRFGRLAADYSLTFNGSLEMSSSIEGSRDSSALPRGEAELKTTVVDGLLFFDAIGSVRQIEVDPFLGRGSAGADRNLRRADFLQLSPHLKHEFSRRVTMMARLDETRSAYSGESVSNVNVRSARLQIEGRPQPIGFDVELQRQDTRYVEQAGSSWTLETAKASVQFAVDDEVILGIIGGRERTDSVLTNSSDSVIGVRARWVPGVRTNLDLRAERRFFGNGFNAEFAHRTPMWAVALAMSREPVTSTGSLGTVSSGASLSEFLDSILTTRYPDAAQRAVLVEGLIASRGLPTELARALELLADYAQLRTAGNFTVTYLSPRTVASISVFAQSLRLLTRDDSTRLVGGALTNDARQGGVEFDVSYALNRQSRVGMRARWLQVRGLGTRLGERTNDLDARLLWSVNLSPRTDVSIGPLWRKVTTNSTTAFSFRETAVQGLLTHRF